jgi:hypothetical protein
MPRESAARSVTPEQVQQLAAGLLLRRQEAQRSTLAFTKYTFRKYQHGEHHAIICDALDRVERGESKRVMFFAPPRHMKTENVSRRFPCRYMGRHPDRQILAVSHTQELADDIGHDVRGIMQSEEYARVFDGVSLAPDSKAQSKWRTNKGGIYIAVGVGGPIIGRGGDLVIIDDPIKTKKEADSQKFRDDLWKWYSSVLLSRLQPNAAIILMHQRWHEDDLAGRIIAAIASGDEPPWEIIVLPAIRTDSDGVEHALWPEWYPIEHMQARRKFMCGTGAARDWYAMYQQQPTAEEGTFFHRAWFEDVRYDVAPAIASLNVYMTGDFAVTPDGGDSTDIGVFGVAPDGDVFVLFWWNGRTSSDVWIDALCQLFDRFAPLFFVGETGPIRRAVEPILRLAMRDPKRRAVACEWLPHGADNKKGNAQSFQGLAAQKRIRFPKTPWAERVIDQLLKFPAGAEDDAVDACSLFGRFIHRTWSVQPPVQPKTTLSDAWGRRPTIAALAAPAKPKEW